MQNSFVTSVSPTSLFPLRRDAAQVPPSRHDVREIKRPKSSAKFTTLKDFIGESKVAASRFFSEMYRVNLSTATFELQHNTVHASSNFSEDQVVPEPLAEGRSPNVLPALDSSKAVITQSEETCNAFDRSKQQIDDKFIEDAVVVQTNLLVGHPEFQQRKRIRTNSIHSGDSRKATQHCDSSTP
jgi:hypothetical protein